MDKRGPAVKYVVRLDAEERQQLEGIIRTGRGAAYRLLKARILLKADVSTEGCGWDDAQIAEALETSLSTVYRTRRQLVEEGLEAALARKTQSTSQPRIFDGEKEAKLIALACSEPPEGYARWSLRLLGECPIFCVTALWSMLPKRSKDDDNFQGITGRTAEGLRAA